MSKVSFKNVGGCQEKMITCPTEGCAEKLLVTVDLERETFPSFSECKVCGAAFYWSPCAKDPTLALYTDEELEFRISLRMK